MNDATQTIGRQQKLKIVSKNETMQILLDDYSPLEHTQSVTARAVNIVNIVCFMFSVHYEFFCKIEVYLL